MNQIEIVVLFSVVAVVLYLTRYWPRLAFAVILLSTAALVLNVEQASSDSLDIFGLTLQLDPAARDLVAVALVLTGALAVATLYLKDRVSLSFLYWSWIPWLVALLVNDFVVGVFAWALGFIIAVFAMKPRRFHRASGAAYFLVVVVIATASLLLANRFVLLYPLTPENGALIQLAVLFLAWGFGLALALFPFQVWLGPMADDAPLPTAASILALGQPIGLVLLFRFLSQNPWLSEKSNLFEIMAIGGLATSIVGGLMAAVERRSGRLLGYAAIFTFGFALLDLSRASLEGLAYSYLELFSRALGLTVFACGVTIGQQLENPTARRVSQAAVLLAGFSLVGLRLGVGLAERWNALLALAGTDMRPMVLLILAHMGLLIGVIRFTRSWWEKSERGVVAETGASVRVEQPLALGSDQLLVPAMAAAPQAAAAAGVNAHGPNPGQAPEQSPANARIPAPGLDSGVGPGSETENARGEEGREPLDGNPPQEYEFEEHVREIVKTVALRARPYLNRAARSVPAGTMAVMTRVWVTWRISVGIGLLVVLIVMLLTMGLIPGAWFDRATASLGQPPLLK